MREKIIRLRKLLSYIEVLFFLHFEICYQMLFFEKKKNDKHE